MLWLVTEIVLRLFLKGCYPDFIFWTTKLCHNSWKLIYLLSCFDFSEMRVGWNQVIIQVLYSVLKCITILTVLFCLFCVWGKLHCILWGRQGDDPVTFWTRTTLAFAGQAMGLWGGYDNCARDHLLHRRPGAGARALQGPWEPGLLHLLSTKDGLLRVFENV